MLRRLILPWCHNFKGRFYVQSKFRHCMSTIKPSLANPVVLSRKTLCQSVYDSSRLDEVNSIEIDDDNDSEQPARTIIQYDPSDPIINGLLECTSVNAAFQIFEEHRDSLKKEHLIQTIFVLWHFLNVFIKVQIQMEEITDVTKSEYLHKLREHPSFQSLLQFVESSCSTFSTDELTCSLLYLSKLDVNLKSNVMQALINSVEEKFKEEGNGTTLAALSRFCVALKFDPELWSQFLLLSIVPAIENKADNISTLEDFRLLTICLLHTNHLVSKRVLLKYKELCDSFSNTLDLTPDAAKTLVKAASFLSLPFWSNDNVSTVRQISLKLKDYIQKLEVKDLVTLTKAFHIHLEPACVVVEVREAIKNYLSSSNPVVDKEINVSVLSCAAQLATHQEKVQIKKLLSQELDSGCLKTPDRKLCDAFWLKTSETLWKHTSERDSRRLYRVGLRYMYFNNNMGGTYRHARFEKQMVNWIIEEMEAGSSSYNPGKMARGVSFLLAYCRDSQTLVSAIDRLLSMKTQLKKVECVLLSRGVEIMLEFTRRRQISSVVMEKLVELDTCLNECAWRHLQEKNLTLTELSALLRTYHNRRASTDSLLFHTLVDRLENTNDVICSRIIRDLSYCLTGLSCLLPNLMNKMAKYIVDNEDSVLAETAERVLTTSFSLGYSPESGESFIDACARLLVRDKERLSSLTIIQMCLALSFFHRFPPDLVSNVFSVDFLERIDGELAHCYSKATYPVRVRYTLMELNRSVCLDLPQLDVPWFHGKYCEEISALDPVLTTPVHQDVHQHLCAVLGSETFIQSNVYSPYGYKINFLILLDYLGKPLLKSEEQKAKQKLAILLHSDHQFTAIVRRLKGNQQMRQRHLEIMGYRVISIPERTWNAMYLTESYAKKMFLSEQLWPER